ncbi:unnamed protein product [marine sediment metagenome]|uniref:Uncharacterized protein n=1 Tax=marine sediment metagenome TaxID=412755 RepID=X0U7B8_9ZZZZ
MKTTTSTRIMLIEDIYNFDKECINLGIYKHSMIPFYQGLKSRSKANLLVVRNHYFKILNQNQIEPINDSPKLVMSRLG